MVVSTGHGGFPHAYSCLCDVTWVTESDMPKVSKLQLVQQRRRQKEAELASLRDRMNAAEQDLADLVVAERVLLSLDEPEAATPADKSERQPRVVLSQTRGPKPEGIPPVR